MRRFLSKKKYKLINKSYSSSYHINLWTKITFKFDCFPKFAHSLSLICFSLQRWRSHLGNKRYLATGWSRGRFGNGRRMKYGEVTIWHGNKGKGEKDTAVSFFVCVLIQDPSYFWLLWSLQEAPKSHHQYFG